MKDIKCCNCNEYRNEWCKKVLDSPCPDMVRDCQYYHEKDPDVIKVIRCKDCKWWDVSPSSTIAPTFHRCRSFDYRNTQASDFCSRAERRKEGEQE